MTAPNWHDLIGWRELKAFVKLGPPAWRRQAIAITGPSGIGKTTAARMLGAELGDDRDNLWLEAGDYGDRESLRDIDRACHLGRFGGRWRVVVIDEAHKLKPTAKSFLLGMLERLPPRNLVVFTATSEAWLDYDGGALRRRVYHFAADGFTEPEIVIHLRTKFNGVAERLGDDKLRAIAQAAGGNLDQAQNNLEMVLVTGQLPLALKRRAG